MATAEFDELNVLNSQIDTIRARFDDYKKGVAYYLDAKEAEDEIEELYIMAYIFGVDYANSILGIEAEPSEDRLEELLNRQIDGKTFRDRVEEHFEEEQYGLCGNVAETGAMSAYNQAIEDVAKDSGMKCRKTWKTVGDMKVRATHDYLEGMTKDLDEPFYTFTGDSALYPGGFFDVENNANCRCHLILTREG